MLSKRVLDIFPTTKNLFYFIVIQSRVLVFYFYFFCSCNAYFLFSPLPRKTLDAWNPNVWWNNNEFETVNLQLVWKLATKEILEKLDDGVFVRTLQCLAAQQQKNQQAGSHSKEPSLMPVPSPQQISYLNQFEGNLELNFWNSEKFFAKALQFSVKCFKIEII